MKDLCAAPEVAFQQPGAPAADDEQPRAARIEILERHNGPKKGFVGMGSILLPNMLRINDVAVLATYDHPAVIGEFEIDGTSTRLFRVKVQLLARALRVGGTPAYEAAAEGGRDPDRGAIVEIPGVDELKDGAGLDLPWVLLNGHRLYVDGPVVIGEMATKSPIQNAAMVTLTLLCRQLIVDDEPLGDPES